jgi:hypothetical protein
LNCFCQKCHCPVSGKYYDICYCDLTGYDKNKGVSLSATTYHYQATRMEQVYLCDSCVLKDKRASTLWVIVLGGVLFLAGLIGLISLLVSDPKNFYPTLFPLILGGIVLTISIILRSDKTIQPVDGEFLAVKVRKQALDYRSDREIFDIFSRSNILKSAMSSRNSSETEVEDAETGMENLPIEKINKE